ncbi:hypothetical protein PanWU01x14_128910 [Parasponia andersonii]|uniref:Uncharacterized protein n=1 Tax=Parasponia andersonii TaxID=3476 RepID=A0A2P5CRQ0_PARAD|nr:hypothetical protein PanWU01x14_128910 [Parasponia andersonii]
MYASHSKFHKNGVRSMVCARTSRTCMQLRHGMRARSTRTDMHERHPGAWAGVRTGGRENRRHGQVSVTTTGESWNAFASVSASGQERRGMWPRKTGNVIHRTWPQLTKVGSWAPTTEFHENQVEVEEWPSVADMVHMRAENGRTTEIQ